MTDRSYLQKIVNELITKDKWSDFLRRFIDVLKINIFVVDYQGRVVIPPFTDGPRGRYGSSFLIRSFKFDFSGASNLIQKFQESGHYLEARDDFDFKVFAVPIKEKTGQIIAYLIVGPVILNMKADNAIYFKIIKDLGLDEDLMDAIHEIRTVSFVSIKSILDLLAGVVKDIVELNLEKKALHQARFDAGGLPKAIADAAQDLYAAIHLDELLVTILDAALNLTQAECGSIMFLDEKKEELSIKVSRGIDENYARKVHLKLGEGIAGLAAKENESFVLTGGTTGDSRIKHLLTRPDIKQSAVIPLAARNRVFGVLNIHTKKDEGRIVENETNLQHFSKLISAAIHSI